MDLTAMLGVQSISWVVFASYFYPHIVNHNITSEPAARVFLKSNLV